MERRRKTTRPKAQEKRKSGQWKRKRTGALIRGGEFVSRLPLEERGGRDF
jgi:hypothetical protein